jgi:hypothetical protein
MLSMKSQIQWYGSFLYFIVFSFNLFNVFVYKNCESKMVLDADLMLCRVYKVAIFVFSGCHFLFCHID